MSKFIFLFCLFILVSRAEYALGTDTQVLFSNTNVTVVIPKGVTVEEKDASVFCTYVFKSAGEIILVGYVGMAPGFPSKYARNSSISKCETNGLYGRIIRWSDKNGRDNMESLFAIPYGNSIGYLHFGSIGKDAGKLKKAEKIVFTLKASVPYRDPRSSGTRFVSRIRRSVLSYFRHILKAEKHRGEMDELDEDVQISLDTHGLYPSLK